MLRIVRRIFNENDDNINFNLINEFLVDIACKNVNYHFIFIPMYTSWMYLQLSIEITLLRDTFIKLGKFNNIWYSYFLWSKFTNTLYSLKVVLGTNNHQHKSKKCNYTFLWYSCLMNDKTYLMFKTFLYLFHDFNLMYR